MPSSSATVTKKVSRRVVGDQKLSESQHIEAALTSSDWKNRVMGIQQLQEFVISQPKIVVATHITKVGLLTVKQGSISVAKSCSVIQWRIQYLQTAGGGG